MRCKPGILIIFDAKATLGEGEGLYGKHPYILNRLQKVLDQLWLGPP